MKRRSFLGMLLAGGGIGATVAFCSKRLGLLALPPAKSRRTLGDEFVYDVDAYLQVPPELVTWQETTPFDTGLTAPRGLDIASDGQVLVGGEKHVRAFSPSGKLENSWEISGTARCLRCLPDGRILVGLDGGVEVVGPGTHIDTPNADAVITGIDADATDGSLYLADAHARIIWRLGPDGALRNRIGDRDEERGIPGFVVPSPFFHLRLAPYGLLLVANPGRHQIEAYTPEGDLELTWGMPGMALETFCGCCNPIHFSPLADARVLTCEKGMPRVKIYSTTGELETVVAAPASFPQNAAACNVNGSYSCTRGGIIAEPGPDGRIYLLDVVTRQVRTFMPKMEG